ncbi:glycosyltransferase 61 family protein [Bradyrhizobium sp. HKCCYLRH3099]|uniref:glycosyltransferase 61 family protein n=1 Tax=unclassified Bradyrhizobium TaxID=2631580 RepID=UPI003EB9A54E
MRISSRESAKLRLSPYLRLAERIVRGPGSLESVATERELLCAEETADNPPTIFLPNQLERVTSGTEHRPLADEIESMLAPTYTHAATIAYHVKDAAVLDGSIYSRNFRHFIADKIERNHSGAVPHLKTAGLASTAVGHRYFGHWLRDDCLQYLLARETGAIINFTTPAWTHKPHYATLFGQTWNPIDRAIVDDLIIYQDFGQNSLKAKRYSILSQLIRSRYSGPEMRDKLVYLRRGDTGVARTIFEEDRLLDLLVKSDFEVIDIATDDIDFILRTLLRAKIVVSMEGSQIAHCCYTLDPGCGLLVLEPSDRFTAVHRHWAARNRVQTGFVVGLASPVGYRFSGDEILQTADLMARQQRI